MKNILLLIILASTLSYSQQLNIRLTNTTVLSANLLSLSGEKVELVDSIRTSKPGEFIYNFADRIFHKGFYRLQLNQQKVVDFVYNGTDIELQTDALNIFDSMKVISSLSNSLYYNFVKLNKTYKTKSELLQLILARYPKDDEYYEVSKARLNALQDEYIEFVYSTSQNEPESFIARYIRSVQLPIINYALTPEEQLKELKLHALDHVDFNDEALIYSDCFSNKAIEYLMYYRNPQLPKELLEKEFTIAVDTLLTKASVNQLVYQHVTEYLIDGFKKFGFDTIIDYILENYVIKDDLCLNEELESSIENRIKQSKLLSVGSEVPDISINDSEGKTVVLSKLKSEKTLLIFYSSNCPHCKEMLPKLSKLYDSQDEKAVEILAISLDEKREDWLDFLGENNFNWINVSDQQGWFGKVARDYYIYATPTMFLLDSEKKIIAKPLNVTDLVKWF